MEMARDLAADIEKLMKNSNGYIKKKVRKCVVLEFVCSSFYK